METAPASPSTSEWLARQRLIDPMLVAQGWKVVQYDPLKPLQSYNACAIKELPTENGPADYALCAGGRIVGIIEAKKLSLGPQNVLTQAERYSRGATCNTSRFGDYYVPFLYASNGKVIWHHDIRNKLNRSRQITTFHTPASLLEKLAEDFDSSLKALSALPNQHPLLRPYQRAASAAIEAAMAKRKRHMLVAMATGTGKTFTMVNQVYRLMKSGAGKRILFLVDRRALAAQAVRAFASFEPEPGQKFDRLYEVYSQRFQQNDFEAAEKFDPKVLPNTYLTNPKECHTFVYVCTIQRMTMNLFGRGFDSADGDDEGEEDAAKITIPSHAFDIIIADECHRGYTAQELSIWRDTLDHFDAIKIGLTATPAGHTTTYFRDIVFRYDYETAVREGYLVDYDLVAVRSEIRMKGAFLKEGELVGVVDTNTGTEQMDRLEDERDFETSDLEVRVSVPDSNRKIIEEIRKYAEAHEARYGRFPKTLIFAVNDLSHTSHADQLVDTARDVFERGEHFVQKITGKVDRPLQRIREFRNRLEPGVVVTVDLLSTGVDIPDLEFIVFLRPVRSRILFEQMLGRGTRKGERWPDKSHFTVFDCFEGTLIEYFRKATAITASQPLPKTRTIPEIIEDIWQNRDRDYNTRCLVKRLLRIDKEMSGDARVMFAKYIEDGDVARYAREVAERLKKDFILSIKLLRDEEFQALLVKYPRPERDFWRGYDARDEVSSEWIVRDIAGNEYKPEDYLQVFENFVKENEDQIQAIRILLKHPDDWRSDALLELRQKLAESPLRFTQENLQKAHQVKYRKAMVDIISMVKHAAREEEGLFTAEERVQRAMMRLTAGEKFTPEQNVWLERLRVHLVENLSIDRDDFDKMPVFADYGGWKKADKIFNGRLARYLRKFNEAVAA